jgi:DNA polymerase III sliding clamp (beta) subunit (PCNA family)
METKNIKKVVNAIKYAIGNKRDLKILRYVRLTNSNAILTITATNLSRFVVAHFNNPTSDFDVLVEYPMLLQTIKSIKDKTITIEYKDGFVCVNDHELYAHDVHGYPSTPDCSINVCTVKKEDIINVLKLRRFTYKTHPSFDHIMVRFNKDHIEAAATDGFILKEIKIKTNAAAMQIFIEPVSERVATILQDSVTISIGNPDRFIAFKTDDAAVIIKATARELFNIDNIRISKYKTCTINVNNMEERIPVANGSIKASYLKLIAKDMQQEKIKIKCDNRLSLIEHNNSKYYIAIQKTQNQ